MKRLIGMPHKPHVNKKKAITKSARKPKTRPS